MILYVKIHHLVVYQIARVHIYFRAAAHLFRALAMLLLLFAATAATTAARYYRRLLASRIKCGVYEFSSSL